MPSTAAMNAVQVVPIGANLMVMGKTSIYLVPMFWRQGSIALASSAVTFYAHSPLSPPHRESLMKMMMAWCFLTFWLHAWMTYIGVDTGGMMGLAQKWRWESEGGDGERRSSSGTMKQSQTQRLLLCSCNCKRLFYLFFTNMDILLDLLTLVFKIKKIIYFLCTSLIFHVLKISLLSRQHVILSLFDYRKKNLDCLLWVVFSILLVGCIRLLLENSST